MRVSALNSAPALAWTQKVPRGNLKKGAPYPPGMTARPILLEVLKQPRGLPRYRWWASRYWKRSSVDG